MQDIKIYNILEYMIRPKLKLVFLFFSEKMSINPWVVDNIQAFYFLKCPECNFINKEESTFQDHAVENHPLSSAFYGESDKTIEKIGIFYDFSEENESNDAFNTVKEELLETTNDHEMDEQIFPIENEVKPDIVHNITNSETVHQIFPERHEFQESEESQMSETSQITRVSQMQEQTTTIPLLTHEYAAAQIAHAIPARESRELSNEAPWINNVDYLDYSQQIGPQPSSSNLISPSVVNNSKKKYKCPKCDTVFTRKNNIERHIAVVHEGQKLFKCSTCDDCFSTNQVLKSHIATVHEGQKPFKCSICDSSFTRSGSLTKHIATVHEGKKPFKCSICDSSFSIRWNLKTHIVKVHEIQKPNESVETLQID